MGTKAKTSEARRGVAAKLIADAKTRGAGALPELALEDVREICAYNDTVPKHNHTCRVSIVQMCETLKAHYGWNGGEKALNTACRAQLGRKSFTTA